MAVRKSTEKYDDGKKDSKLLKQTGILDPSLTLESEISSELHCSERHVGGTPE